MSDNQQPLTLDQQKMQEIMTHDTRTAVNMEKTRTGYDREYYSMDKTMEDTRFISRVLRGVDAQELNLTEQDKQHLRIVNSRNKSHILLNQQKFLGDSGLMRTVKESVSRLESMLAEENTSILRLNDIQEAYRTAISACRTYRDNKNPWFPKGKARKQMVEKRLNALQRELELFKSARATIASSGEDFPLRPIDLFDLAETIKNRQQNNEPGNPEERQEDQVIAENIQKEPVVEEIVEEKKEESVIEKEKTDEKKEEVKKEEKIIVEEKKEEIVEEKKEEKREEKKEEKTKEQIIKEENKKAVYDSMHKKYRNINMPSEAEKKRANKVVDEHIKDLLKRSKDPVEFIKDKAISNRYSIDGDESKNSLDDLLFYFEEDVIFDTNTFGTPFHYLWEDWRKTIRNKRERLSGSDFDKIKKLVEGVRDDDDAIGKRVWIKKDAGRILNKMDSLYDAAAKDCPILSRNELEAIVNKLSGTMIEQKQAVDTLRDYAEAIKKWDMESKGKTGQNYAGMHSDIGEIYNDIKVILSYHEEVNPIVYNMTDEEVAAYQDHFIDAPRERQRQLDMEELNNMVTNRSKDVRAENIQDAKKDLEERKEQPEKERKEKAAKQKEERRQEELRKQEEARKEELRKQEELKKKQEEEERIRKEEEKRIKKEQEELKKKQEEEERIRKEAEKKEQEKKKENTLYDTSDDIVQTMLKEGEKLYEKLKEEAEVCCKNGLALINLTRARGYNKVQHLLLPLMSEKGCTWDALVMVIRLGAYVGEQYEDYFGARALQNVREKVLLPIIESKYIPDTDSLTPYDSYLPTDDILLNTKLKFTSNGLVILPEEARKMIASAFSHLDLNEVELFDNSSDFMSSVADVYKDYANRKGISETSFGDNYYGGRFCESTMRTIIGWHPELIG
jgi:hypothetical protein